MGRHRRGDRIRPVPPREIIRMDKMEQSMKRSREEAVNVLAALMGEMDDKVDRSGARGDV